MYICKTGVILIIVSYSIFSCNVPKKIMETQTSPKDTVTIATPIEKSQTTSKGDYGW